MALLPEGIYKIASVSDETFVWDVDNNSQSNGAELFIFTYNGGNNQKFLLKNSTNDYCFLYIAHSLKVVDVEKANQTIKNLDNVFQWAYNGGTNQQWLLEKATSTTGKDCLVLRSRTNNNFVADNANSYLVNRNNVIAYQYHNSDNQKWLILKDTFFNSSMAVPSDIGGGLKGDTESRTSYDITAIPQIIYPMWKCDGALWQVRYRYRGRKVGSTSYEDFGPWTSLNGSTENSGFEDPWIPNCEIDEEGIQKKTTKGVTVAIDQIEYDRYEYQFSVRLLDYREMLDQRIPQTGSSNTGTITLNYMPTLSIQSFVLTGRGLVIEYSSDFKRAGNTFTFDLLRGNGRRKLTVREHIFSDKDYTGTVLIPFSDLAYIPTNGEEIMFNTTTQTIDTSRKQSFTRALSFDANHGLDINASFEYFEDGAILEGTPAKEYEDMECHIIYEQDGEVVIADCEYFNGRYIILPPFNKDYTIMISAKDGDNWGVKTWPGQRIKSEGHMFNFEDEYFRLLLSEEPYNGPSITYEADSESYMFQGDRRESVYFNFGAQVSPTISGICPLDDAIPLSDKPYPKGCSLNDFHKLRLNKYAVYRDIYGRRYNVAITGTDEAPYNENLFSVSITMKERM